ncbi:hypothetical protein ACFFWD_10400 [Bradyrhizobium erythrophlei]|uniref:hypothetical protein n=1 Tax=Bradyrhizobium erythrophlei TaxID=1437360 RepID=UPI0035E918AC
MAALTDAECLELALTAIIANPAKLNDEPRQEVAKFAVHSSQIDNLHLAPWQKPPCLLDDPSEIIARGKDDVNYESARLLRHMRNRHEPSTWASRE